MPNETGNSTSAYDTPAGPDQYLIVGVISTLATVLNLFILIVFCSSKLLLRHSSLLVGLTIAHTLNGLTHAISGFWSPSHKDVLVNPLYCIEIVWPGLYITTYQVLPLLLAMAGLERLLATAAPLWYRSHCTDRRQWIGTSLALASTVISMAVSWTVASATSDRLIGAYCVTPSIVGATFANYGVHLPAVLGGACAFVCSAIGIFAGKSRIRRMPHNSTSEIRRIQRQVRLTACLLSLSTVDMLFVVIPNLLLMIHNSGLLYFPLRYTIYPVMLYCVDSVCNILAFLMFNRDFRRVSMNVLKCSKMSSVGPTSMDGGGMTTTDHHNGHHQWNFGHMASHFIHFIEPFHLSHNHNQHHHEETHHQHHFRAWMKANHNKGAAAKF